MGVEVERLSEESYSFRAATSTRTTYARTTTAPGQPPQGFGDAAGSDAGAFRRGLHAQAGRRQDRRRRLDTHFIGFQKLGATLDFDTAAACSEVRCKELKGCYMLLDEASVTGTANIIMAAVMAKGFTTIYTPHANLTSSNCA